MYHGAFVKALQDAGFENGYGYDIAENLVEDGKKDGLKLYTGDLNNLCKRTQNFSTWL